MHFLFIFKSKICKQVLCVFVCMYYNIMRTTFSHSNTFMLAMLFQRTVREALNSALDEEMSADPRVFLIGEEVLIIEALSSLLVEPNI